MDLRWVAPRFLEHVEQKKRVELVSDFAITSAAIVAAMDVEGIIRGDD